MKKLVILFAFVLASCGSGGGGGSSSTPAAPLTLNTAVPDYLPAASGNYWSFPSGSRMVDGGPYTVVCSCGANGQSMERIELFPAGSQTISSSFFFTKDRPLGGSQITNLIGVESDSGVNNISGFSTTGFEFGVPVMDDAPATNEAWNDGAGDTSTIVSTGATLALGSTAQVVGVATDRMSGGSETISWGFAHGVGFTMIGVGTQTINISSFYVNAATSTGSGSRPEALAARRGFIRPDGNASAIVRSALQRLL